MFSPKIHVCSSKVLLMRNKSGRRLDEEHEARNQTFEKFGESLQYRTGPSSMSDDTVLSADQL
jgi:hypothetical protein